MGVSGRRQGTGLSGVKLWRCRVVVRVEGVWWSRVGYIPSANVGRARLKGLKASGLQCWGCARAALALCVDLEAA